MHRRIAHLVILALIASELAVAAPIAVRGAVRRTDGTPLPGVRAELMPVPSNFQWARLVLVEERAVPEPVATVETDAAGRFSLAAPGAGLWRVAVRRAGFVPMRFFVLPAANSTVLAPVVLVPDEGARVEVRATSGEPAAGVWVYAESASEGLWQEIATHGWRVGARVGRSDEHGRLALPRAAGERLKLHAFVPGSTLPASSEGDEKATLTLRPAPSRREIAVHTKGGEPLAGLVVVSGIPPWPAGTTDEQGRLTLTGLFADPLPLRFFAADGRCDRGLLQPLPAGDESQTRLLLARPARLAGRVVDGATRQPVAGAVVWPRDDPGSFVLTDAEGRYELPSRPGDRSRLQADAPGFLPAVAEVRAGAGRSERVPTLALTAATTAHGRTVGPKGEPVTDVDLEVRATSPTPPSFHPEPLVGRAVSDGEGRFVLAGLHPEGTYEVQAEKAGFATAWVELKPVAGKPLRIRLAAARRAFGQVVDGEEQPLPGVEVRLRAAAGTESHRHRALTATSDDRGRFELAQVPAPKVDVAARKSGYSPLTVRGVEIPPGRGPADLGTLVLERGVALHGTVAEAGGEPIAEARVWVAENLDRTRRTARQVKYGPPRTVTDAAGHFQVGDLQRGRKYDLFFDHPQYLPVSLSGVAAPSREPLAVVLEAAAAVSGRVVAEDGEPIVGARVNLSRETAPQGRIVPRPEAENEDSVLTHEGGYFAFRQVMPGAVAIEAYARGYLPAPPLGLEIREGEAVAGLSFVLERGAVVEGWVSSRRGEPVAGAEIRGRRVGATSDAEGFYRLEGVPPGRLALEVRHPEYSWAERTIEIDSAITRADFVLTGGWPVSGRVMADDGRAVADVRVELRLFPGQGYREYQAVSGEDGRFHFPRVVDGRCRLRAEKEGYAPARRDEGCAVAGGPIDDLELVLTPGAVIAGQILGLEFDELAGVRVRAQSDAGDRRDGIVDYAGSYRIADLAAGDWLVKAWLEDGSRQAENRVVIAPGVGSVRRDLEFRRGLTLFGRIEYGGEPLSDTRVTVTGYDLAIRRTVATDHQGSYRIADLEPGRYRMSLSNPRELLIYNQDLELVDDRRLDVEIATAAVSGVVVSAATSRPLAEATVAMLQLLSPDGSQTGSVVTLATDAEGTFHVARLTAGRHRLSVHKEGYEPLEQILEVDPGAELHGLELALTPAAGLDLVVRLASGQVPDLVTVGLFDAAERLVQTEGSRPDAEGYVRFSTLPAGSWTLLVGARGGAAIRVPAAVPGPVLDVVLPPASRFRVRVPALAESNLVARLTIAGQDGRPFEVLESSGVVRREWNLDGGTGAVGEVPVGVWTLRVMAADGRLWERTITAAGQPEIEVSLE